MPDPPPSTYSKPSLLQADSGKLLGQSSTSGRSTSGRFDSGQSGDSGQYLSADSSQYVDDQYGTSGSSDDDDNENSSSDYDLLNKGSDPDGSYRSDAEEGSTSSKHGERLNPTLQDSFDDIEDVTKANSGNAELSDRHFVDEDDYVAVEDGVVYPDSNDTFSDNYPDTDYSERLVSSNSLGIDASTQDIEVDLFSDEPEPDTKTKNSGGAQNSPFPSNKLLVSMVVLVVIATGVIIGCVTYFAWEKVVLDPMVPPGGIVLTPSMPEVIDENNGDGDGRPLNPIVPSDEDLLKLFASVTTASASGNANVTAVEDPLTASGKAAQWMLYEDPGKTDPTLLPRSDKAWIQRYILTYTYFATTTNANDGNTTLWNSCNPPFLVSNEIVSNEELAAVDENDCLFADTVPSKRWLSGTDECQWGGVACGNTVIDDVTVAVGEIIQYLRSPVTSIVLTDQNLQGSIVNELSELPFLEILDLSHNGLEGSLIEDFRTLTKLKLQHNKMTGMIPVNFFGDTSLLEEFNVGANHMEGIIPSTVGLASNLKLLSVHDNAFTGTIPVLGNMPLETFHGQNNLFKGILPFDYGYGGTWPNTLKEWVVYNNTLTGSIPEGIGFVSDLEDLRLHHNQFHGSIPESIGQLERLFRFEAQSNFLVGTIPESIGLLPALRDVRVQFNQLSGEVPPAMCFLETMYALEADCYFDDAGTIRIEIEDNSPDEVIPSFATLEEAVAAARAQGIDIKTPPGASTPVPVPKEVQCYCCTKCCNSETGDCLRFETKTITEHTIPVAVTKGSKNETEGVDVSMSVNSGLNSDTTSDALKAFKVNFINV